MTVPIDRSLRLPASECFPGVQRKTGIAILEAWLNRLRSWDCFLEAWANRPESCVCMPRASGNRLRSCGYRPRPSVNCPDARARPPPASDDFLRVRGNRLRPWGDGPTA